MRTLLHEALAAPVECTCVQHSTERTGRQRGLAVAALVGRRARHVLAVRAPKGGARSAPAHAHLKVPHAHRAAVLRRAHLPGYAQQHRGSAGSGSALSLTHFKRVPEGPNYAASSFIELATFALQAEPREWCRTGYCSCQRGLHAQGPDLRVVHRPIRGRRLRLLQEPLHVFGRLDAGRRRGLLAPRKAADAQHVGEAALWPLPAYCIINLHAVLGHPEPS